jgi:hypothetical protein
LRFIGSRNEINANIDLLLKNNFFRKISFEDVINVGYRHQKPPKRHSFSQALP